MAKMDKSVQKTLIIVVGILVLVLLVFAFIGNTAYARTISSTGTATIHVLPDFVSIYFTVETTGVNASIASDKNAEIVGKMKSALFAAGITENEIKTISFSVYPDYDYRRESPIITSYRAVHSIKVEVPIADKNRIGNVIDAGIGARAGISYINYELSDENQTKYKVEAIKLATEDATAKAGALAEGSGSRLGSLVSISTDFGYVPWLAVSPETTKDSTGAEIATQINPSEQEISAMVTAVFKIR